MNNDMEKCQAVFKQKLLVENVPDIELREILIAMIDIGLESYFACNVLHNLPNSMTFAEEEDDRILALMDVVVGWCSANDCIW